MELLTKEDLSINGSGSSAGGTFRRVDLNGHGKVNGNLACVAFESNGFGTVNGDVEAQTVRMNGFGKINGSVSSTETVQIDGKGFIEKGATINKMTVNGLTTIGGPVKGNNLVINGKVTIEGDCEVDQFNADGGFKIKGLLSADKIEIKVQGNCHAQEIGGQDIRVRQHTRGFMNLLKPFFSLKLETNLIEGNTIELEGTHAKVVRGETIVIGRDCDIELVEYTGTLKNEKGSKIKEVKKV
ncbi:MAG TPA: cytoplasmic protein [Sporolactobacillaceae bacterium]|nr:cytoplasmic protein [Sporolactobacillaceae bacterium]